MRSSEVVSVLGIKEGLLYRVARRWISGKDLEGALRVAQAANKNGMGVILNYLGEDVVVPEVAQRQFEEYLRVQQAVSEGEIDGCISVKLTQFGLGIDEASAMEKAERLAREAEARHQFLWLDMEGSASTQRTLDIYSDLRSRHRDVGVALQAYLRRSQADLLQYLPKGATFRLVKGAYREPEALVFKSREEVRENYLKLMRLLFERSTGFAIGTHDSAMIEEAKRLAGSRRDFQFQMLKGIRDELKSELVASGFRVVEYLPYGQDWYAYSMRRIREHPSNIWLLIRSML